MEYNNDPALLEAHSRLQADFISLCRERDSWKEMNEFLRNIITTLISSRNV